MQPKPIKIYCQTCREYILDASDEFIPGGPYHGAMFAEPSQARYDVDIFAFMDHVTRGDLWCPRCEQQFIVTTPEGEVILTEHGLLTPGCKNIDRSTSVITDDALFSLQRVDVWNGAPGVVRVPGSPSDWTITDRCMCQHCGVIKKTPQGRASHEAACRKKEVAATITFHEGAAVDDGRTAVDIVIDPQAKGEVVEQLTQAPDLDALAEGLPPGVVATSAEDLEDREGGFDNEGLPAGVV